MAMKGSSAELGLLLENLRAGNPVAVNFRELLEVRIEPREYCRRELPAPENPQSAARRSALAVLSLAHWMERSVFPALDKAKQAPVKRRRRRWFEPAA